MRRVGVCVMRIREGGDKGKTRGRGREGEKLVFSSYNEREGRERREGREGRERRVCMCVGREERRERREEKRREESLFDPFLFRFLVKR
jgi:hypothetical protein